MTGVRSAAASDTSSYRVTRCATVEVRVCRSVSACALPRPSATASARFAKTTVSQSQIAMPQVNADRHRRAARRPGAAEERLGDGDHRGERRADLDDEHDGVVPHLSRVELAQGAGERLEELRRTEAAHGALRRRTHRPWGVAGHFGDGGGHGSAQPFRQGTQRENGEIGEGGDEDRHADEEADELRPVGGEGARGRGHLVLRGEAAREGEHEHDRHEPAEQHRDAERRVEPRRVRRESREGGAVVVRRRGERVEHLGHAVDAGVPDRHGLDVLADAGDREAQGGAGEHERRRDEDVEARELDLARADLLAEVLGRAAHQEAGDEHRDDREHQHAVEAGSDAAGGDLAEHHVQHRHHAAERGVRVVHRVHRTGRREGRGPGEQRRGEDAVPLLLALHRPAGELGGGARAVQLECAQRGDRDDGERRHDGQDRVALLVTADHPAEGARERERDGEQECDLEEVRPAGRVLERVRGVRIEEPAAVRAELLDDLLRGNRSARQVLGVAGERRDLGEAVEVLHHAARDQYDRADDRDREQQPERPSEQVDPEVSDRAGPAAREATHQGDGHRDADRGRHEVLHGQAGELHGIAHRDVGRVRLPVRVRHEGGRRVERQAFGNGGEAERVRQDRLRALEDVHEDHADDREGQHAPQVRRPRLLGAGVDADDAVEAAFDPPVLRRRVDVRHVVAEGAVQEREDQDEGGRLCDGEQHIHQNRSGLTRAYTRYTTAATPNATARSSKKITASRLPSR